jgi:hypothetical protein
LLSLVCQRLQLEGSDSESRSPESEPESKPVLQLISLARTTSSWKLEVPGSPAHSGWHWQSHRVSDSDAGTEPEARDQAGWPWQPGRAVTVTPAGPGPGICVTASAAPLQCQWNTGPSLWNAAISYWQPGCHWQCQPECHSGWH